MLKKFALWIIIVGGGVFLIYIVIVVYGNLQMISPPKNPYSFPDADKAKYSIVIKNTGNTLFSNDVEEVGNLVIVHGYWELIGTDFKWRDATAPLDKQHFGPITVRARQ